MSEAELRRALAAAVRAGRLTPDEAAAYVRAVRAGRAPSPATPAEAEALLGAALAAGLARALAALGLITRATAAAVIEAGAVPPASTPTGRRIRAGLLRLPRVPHREKVRATIMTARGFDQDAFQLAARLSGYRGAPGFRDLGDPMTVRQWHRAARARVAEEFVTNAASGLGRVPTAADLRRLRPALAEQLRYLDSFAAEAGARQAAGRPLTRQYVSERLRMYEGAARAQFYELGEAEDQRRSGDGTVYDVEGSDDGGTCGPCAEGMDRGPYLAGEGFIPGRDCRGRGKCRHRRVPRFDPVAYARLRAPRAARV